MDPINSIKKLLALLKDRCPVLCPSIFSSHFRPKSIESICTDSSICQKLKTMAGLSDTLHIVFPTTIDISNGKIVIDSILVCNAIDI